MIVILILSNVTTFFYLGLKKGYVNKPNAFVIDTRGAGPGDLSLAVEGPSKVDVECIDNGDGTVTATYIPRKPGTNLSLDSNKMVFPMIEFSSFLDNFNFFAPGFVFN